MSSRILGYLTKWKYGWQIRQKHCADTTSTEVDNHTVATPENTLILEKYSLRYLMIILKQRALMYVTFSQVGEKKWYGCVHTYRTNANDK